MPVVLNSDLENGFVSIKRCKHGTFMFNRNDRFIGKSLDYYGEWSESEINLLEHFLKRGDTVIDIGANIGTHTVAFANFVGETGTVLAFEPQRLAFQMLCGNIAINCLTNVRCMQQAVGDAPGQTNAPIVNPHEQHNFGAVSLTNNHRSGEVVDLVSIDSLNLNACNLIKIDVEGMEPGVIKGARETIEKFRPMLFVENNTIDKASATNAAIHELGYDAWWHLSLYYNKSNHFKNRENIFSKYQPEANLLCLPKGVDPEIPFLIRSVGTNDNWQLARNRGIAERNPLFFPT